MNIGQNAARLERPNATRQPLTARITRCGPILAIRTEERRHLGRATRRPSRRFCFSEAKRPSGRPPLRRSSRTSSGSSDDPASGSCIHDERKSEPGDFSLTWLLLRNGSRTVNGISAESPSCFWFRSAAAASAWLDPAAETAASRLEQPPRSRDRSAPRAAIAPSQQARLLPAEGRSPPSARAHARWSSAPLAPARRATASGSSRRSRSAARMKKERQAVSLSDREC